MGAKKGGHQSRQTEFTSESANLARIKSLVTRREKGNLIKLIDDNYANILAILSTTSEKDLKKAVEEWKDMPIMLKAYLSENATDRQRRWLLELVVNRVKGKPKICVDQDIRQTGDFNIISTTKSQADELNKAMED